MFAALLIALSLASGPYRTLDTCETYAPRLDGSEVTVCRGTVTRVAMAPRVYVDAIEGSLALVIASPVGDETLGAGATWVIAASRLPEGTQMGDYVLLGASGAVLQPNKDRADMSDPMNNHRVEFETYAGTVR